ncbi:uncharacterized protein RBU33_024163 isoform 1-T2 [Hipposideros larvatus]
MARPTAGRCKFGPAALAPPPRDARELGESRGRAGPDLRGRAWAPPTQRAFVFVQDKGPSRRWSRTRRPDPAGRSSARSGGSIQGSRSPEKRSGAVRGAARDRGSGAWLCTSSVPSRRRPALRRVAGEGTRLLSAVSAHREGRVRSPALRPMAKGLCSRGHDRAALAASRRRVPLARARPPTCAPRVAIGLKAAPEYGVSPSSWPPYSPGEA